MIDCSKTENYFAEKLRMTKAYESGFCRIRCEHCPLDKKNSGEDVSCIQLELKHPERAVEIVQRWSDEHPPKTYLTELLKNYPNTPLDDDGAPKSLCPHALGLVEIDDCDGNCAECWNQIIKDGEE